MTKVLQLISPGRASRLAGLIVLAVVCVTTMSAAPISGSFGAFGNGVLTFVDGGVGYLDFCPTQPSSPATGSATCGIEATGIGNLIATGGTDDFVLVNPSSAATILDISSAPPLQGSYTTFPVGAANQNIDNFITLAAYPNYNFQADYFVPQGCPTTASQECIGGFVLSQVGQNVSISATINGEVYDNGVLAGTYTHTLSGQITNSTIAAVRAAALTPGGIYSNTFSNTIEVLAVPDNPVPEPATMGLLGGALLALGLLKRRQRVQS